MRVNPSFPTVSLRSSRRLAFERARTQPVDLPALPVPLTSVAGSEQLRLPTELSSSKHQGEHELAMRRALGVYAQANSFSMTPHPEHHHQFAAGAEARMLQLLSGLQGLQRNLKSQIST